MSEHFEVLEHLLILLVVHTSSPLSLPCCYSNVYFDEHQNRWLLRRLLILCAKLPLQHWIESHKDGDG